KAWELIARLEPKTKTKNQDKDQSQNQQQVVSNVKKKGINWIGIFFVVILGVVGTLCCLIQFSRILLPSTSDVYSTPTTYRVTYKITGTASRASLTYQNAQGGTEQTVVSIPWKESLIVESGDFLYLSAQNEGEFGSVTCEIWVNDVKWKESTSQGAYVIATCSGSAGRE
ncbi:MAG TPA: hypothetical protein PKH77_15360, partial [Anaerolineae bacterium]|nr:hypothetical protein [Anaerolineae bacterium]